jgi:hypothetical protein
VPGKQVKNWKVYHALRKHGMPKRKAARIANSKYGKKKHK